MKYLFDDFTTAKSTKRDVIFCCIQLFVFICIAVWSFIGVMLIGKFALQCNIWEFVALTGLWLMINTIFVAASLVNTIRCLRSYFGCYEHKEVKIL